MTRQPSTRSVAVLANRTGEKDEQIKALIKSEKTLKTQNEKAQSEASRQWAVTR